MLNLMKIYQSQLPDPTNLDSTILLQEYTAVFVDIFCNDHSRIDDVYDVHIQKLLPVVEFFQQWEHEFSNSKDIAKHLLTHQTREDIDSCIYGFVQMVKCASSFNISLIPGYFNSDLIENWFCQICGLRNGSNQNPTLRQIGPAINSNLITGSVISHKGNAGGGGIKTRGVMPPTKKFKVS